MGSGKGGSGNISIHTSAKEVTRPNGVCSQSMIISIHTSAKEVTITIGAGAWYATISIHTSAKEVTPRKKSKVYAAYFNPHFREGSDAT